MKRSNSKSGSMSLSSIMISSFCFKAICMIAFLVDSIEPLSIKFILYFMKLFSKYIGMQGSRVGTKIFINFKNERQFLTFAKIFLTADSNNHL
jgi:hypothetical protein